jgi:hypothetical protein
MFTRFYLIFSFLFCLSFSGCTTTDHDERYEFPSADFPKLVDVPDRPKIPSKSELQKTKQELQFERDQAIARRQSILQPPQ